MITDDKITEIFCATDEFSKKFDEEIENMPLLTSDGKARRRRAASMSDSEIMTILIMFHFGTFDNFKHYYLHFIRIHLKRDFPDAVSYNRFVELESRVFFKMMFFLNLHSFGRCTGITFVDSTMIPVCHNLRRYANRVFAGLATDGKGTMGWCHGFKLHFLGIAAPQHLHATVTLRFERGNLRQGIAYRSGFLQYRTSHRGPHGVALYSGFRQTSLYHHATPKGKHAFLFISECWVSYLQNYILAFCLSPAPEPRYFERASLNFHVRSSMKVRRAGLWVVRLRRP